MWSAAALCFFFAKFLQKWIQDFARIFANQIILFFENGKVMVPTVKRLKNNREKEKPGSNNLVAEGSSLVARPWWMHWLVS